MWKTIEGSTGRLIQLCIGYFVFYVITGVSVKYFLGIGMPDMQYLVYSTIGGNLIALLIVLSLKWYRLQSNKIINFLGINIPEEYLYIIPSGICTAIVIPTTTLMYSLPISVMVAMVIMRGSVIIISRLIDAIQIRQGILKKRVYMEENIAVVFALLAVAINLFFANGSGGFDFVADFAGFPSVRLLYGFGNTTGIGARTSKNGDCDSDLLARVRH